MGQAKSETPQVIKGQCSYQGRREQNNCRCKMYWVYCENADENTIVTFLDL